MFALHKIRVKFTHVWHDPKGVVIIVSNLETKGLEFRFHKSTVGIPLEGYLEFKVLHCLSMADFKASV